MLTFELAGQPYVKSIYNKALVERIGRPHGSVEFKHQNVSAVLDRLGMPWIRGYKPRKNFQNAIFDAIDRYLTAHEDIVRTLASPPAKPISGLEIFVEVPQLAPERVPARLLRLIQKFDPVERDYRNRSLGRAGERFVLDVERRRLMIVNRSDLARKIRWISAEEGDGAGYDILSFDSNGREQLLEVKTTNGSARTPFFLSRNECDLARERSAEWRIYRVHLFSTEPRIFTILPPLEQAVNLRPETWRASFA
jgi:Domain of unknown function (DUF3883)